MTIKISKRAGTFAENKDIARDIRERELIPGLKAGKTIVLDFDGVSGATQSFIHALISEPIREYGDNVFDSLVFKNCSNTVKEVINIVADYMQESE